MLPVTIVLSAHTRGDTWDGIAVGPVQFNTGTTAEPIFSAPPYPVVLCRMQFRNADGILGYGLSTAPSADVGTITIVDADLWTLTIPPQVLQLDAGKWYWDMEFTDSIGTIRTLYAGSLTIKQDQTYG